VIDAAQTNLQLYNRLQELDYSHQALGDLRGAYDLARELFSGLYRPSGKTFIAHLVGTASILAECQVGIEVIKAGLMHAAYAAGDFGNGKKGVSDFKREQLKNEIGESAEEIVFEYETSRWPPVNIHDLSLQASAEDSAAKNSALVRLANELEEYIDLGICYCHESARKRISFDLSVQDVLTQMAEQLGHMNLAQALAEAFKCASNADVPDVVRSKESSGRSILVPPRTYQSIMKIVASRIDS